MSIVYRQTKGSKLTIPEVDGNFSYLDGRIDTVSQSVNEIFPYTGTAGILGGLENGYQNISTGYYSHAEGY